MKQDEFIGADALTEALTGHRDRMSLHGPKPIDRIIASSNVDVEEFHACLQALVEGRQPEEEDLGPYTAGAIDGFVLGVRAARAAAAASGGIS